MFGDTDLPLALIMEEILGWEKKPGQEKKRRQTGSRTETAIINKYRQFLRSIEAKERSWGENLTSVPNFFLV